VPLEALTWTPTRRTAFVSGVAIVLGSLFVTSYSLSLGDPVPHHLHAAVVGDPSAHPGTVRALENVGGGSVVFRRYSSVAAAQSAIHHQQVYAALDLETAPPTLYVASAAGASVARLLERVALTDPGALRVVDTHPLAATDPSGVDVFYLMLVATIVAFITAFQVSAHGGELTRRQWEGFVVVLAVVASLVFVAVDGPLLRRLGLPFFEAWLILGLQMLAVASFAVLMQRLLGRWAIVPTWLFFVVLGNSASGGAVAPPLLPPPIGLLSEWLPSGATVTALRNAVYFRDYQQVRPFLVLAAWAVLLFVAMVASGHGRLRRVAMSRPSSFIHG
jgi:hypothetical protein